jgi:pSer/pThr/pTyr-binding forkhead associated (FHA) protein
MAILLILEPGQPDRRCQIKGKECSIGRDENSDILLPHTTVSRKHAKIIRKTKDHAEIHNLSKKNTVLVNGNKKETQKLQTKDTIQIGKFTLIFFGDNLTPMEQFFEGKALEDYPIYARTANATKGDGTFTLSATEAERMLRMGNLTRSARIRSQDKKHNWTPGSKSISFGGSEEIHVEGWFTGGKVAEIRWDGATHVIEKSSALIKIMVNGNKISGTTALNEGDEIQIGKSIFTYDLS